MGREKMPNASIHSRYRSHFAMIATTIFCTATSSAWTTPSILSTRTLGRSARHRGLSFSKDDETKLEKWQMEGERIIKDAATSVGALEEQISVVWKGGKILVTVDGSTYISAMDDDDLLDGEDEFELDVDDEDISSEDIEEIVDELDLEKDVEPDGSDVISIARAINAALDSGGAGSVGWFITENHEIEVTTPGASDVLSSPLMFEAYKGFDVIVDSTDKKSGKKKIIEGKLVERNEEILIINVKGRMRKLKNELVNSVKLPKAKKEKKSR